MANIGRRLWDALKYDTTLTRFSLADYLQYFTFNGNRYSFAPSYSLDSKQEEPDPSFEGYVSSLYKSNAIVFACMNVRSMLFQEARFQFRQIRKGRPGDLFGTDDLGVLENPWPNGATRDLLARIIQDVDLAGNSYTVRAGRVLHRLRPDWVSIVLGSKLEEFEDAPSLAPDAEVLGYFYHPGGYHSNREPIPYLVEQVAHFAPITDPIARYRGMSWLTPIVRDVMGDNAATQHKLAFWEGGATKNLAVTTDPSVTGEAFKDFVSMFKEQHGDLEDVYKVMFLGGGASIEPVGADMQEADFKGIQGAGETRICMAAGVPPVIAGSSEGLASATYSNYKQALRRLNDLTMRPLWGGVSCALAPIVDVPESSELWYDDREIRALDEDSKDAAEILQVNAQTIKGLTEAGFDPQSVVDAVISGDFERLSHTGLLSVQMQAPGSQAPSSNGKPEVPVEAP
jgi:hypothetical protein